MEIKDGILQGAPFKKSQNISGVLNPTVIVMHYTAGYTAQSAIDILTKSGGKASAHVVVDLDGSITQLVDFDTAAWHAGPSKWEKLNGLNQYAIGIEIVNIGFLKKTATEGRYMDAYGSVVDGSKFEELIAAKEPRVGSDTYFWPIYPEAQLKAVEELTKTLIDVYPITDIVTHQEIDTRGWKTDPGPAFPMKRFIKLLDKDDRNLDDFDPSIRTYRYRSTVNDLNVRVGAGSQYASVRKLAKGEMITTNKISIDGKWVKLVDGNWVSLSFLVKA